MVNESAEILETRRVEQEVVELKQMTGRKGLWLFLLVVAAVGLAWSVGRATGNENWGWVALFGATAFAATVFAATNGLRSEFAKLRHLIERLD
jgi:hypothetical protein